MKDDPNNCSQKLSCDGCGLPPRVSSETGRILPLRRCQCRHTWYHDADCQRKHFKEHRKHCHKPTKTDTGTLSPDSSAPSRTSLEPSPFLIRATKLKPGQWLQIATTRIDQQSFARTSNNENEASSVLYSIGTPCQVEKHIDDDIVHLSFENKSTIAECKDFADIELLTPLDIHTYNDSVWSDASQLWMAGVKFWYNQRAYLDAMDAWDRSIACFKWNDINPNGHGYPPLRTTSQKRIALARRLVFLAYCRLDANEIKDGRRYLMRAIQTLPRDKTDIASMAFAELMLSYEEEQNMGMARTVAGWAIAQNCCDWKDVYQRPGFMFLLEGKVQLPHYPMREKSFNALSWCEVLENNWELIRDEYLELIKGRGAAAAQSNVAPKHWSRVGSGERGSGHDDHRVVSGGGDWRELVLFGSGASASHIAPKTKALLYRHAPDAIALAQAGGGEVIFSVLAPHTTIQPHCASTNLRLTAHLGLEVPVIKDTCKIGQTGIPKCAIRVREKWHTWTAGKMLVFDDSYEHEVVNNTEFCRGVLLLRFWHPAVSRNSRHHKLSEALQRKEEDVRRRYNPPLASELSKVEDRGMELSSCLRCFQNGYTNIFVEGNNFGTVRFECSCGEPIM